MSIRNLFALKLFVCALVIGLLSIGPIVKPVSAGQNVKAKILGAKRIGRGQQIHLPIVPYIANDYYYYYSRGFYPTHIGPGYIYKNYHVTNKRDYGYRGKAASVPYSAVERCARRFRSFNSNTGRYTTYGGKKKLCPYLR